MKSYSRKRSKMKKVDRISSLPDHLLCRILAFLPTRSAVANSVLSQRWEHLWPRIPVLDFTYNSHDNIVARQKYRILTNFLNRVLLHNSALCLERVNFDVLPVMTEKDKQKWFMVLARRSIKEVNLSYYECYKSCDRAFTNLLGGIAGEHLVKLKIVWVSEYNITFTFTSMLHFPRLEIVHLKGVDIDGDGEPISSLVEGSPCLRELVLSECRGRHMDFCCSTLKILTLFNCEVTMTNIEVRNLEHLEFILDEDYYLDHGSLDGLQLVIDDMPRLSEAKIYKCRMRAATWAYLLHKVRHVTKLDMSLSTFFDEGEEVEEMEEVEEDLTMDFNLPYFKRLICLELRCNEELSLLQTRLFLSHMPNCASLIIHMHRSSICAADLLTFLPTNNSSSVGQHVEYIEIHGIGGTRLASVELLRYLLDCCEGLKELKLHLYRWISSGWKNVMLKMIMNLPRPEACKIIICE